MITAAIITKNEDANIERCLKSLGWVNEILIVDSGSIDNTLKICESYNCRIIKSDWLGFGKTKKFAVDSANNDWILSIDADEEISPALMDSIKNIDLSNIDLAFKIKRISYYLGGRVLYSGWQNDYPIRFFNRKTANFNNKPVHEKVEINSDKVIEIKSPIFHYPYKNISEHIEKINSYTTLSSNMLFKEGKKVFLIYPFLACFLKFIKVYFFRFGFLDGYRGIILCSLSAFYVYLKYIKLWSLDKDEDSSY